MNLELPSNAYNIKIDFKNKLKIKNDSDINEETSELNIISKYFEKEIPLEVLNSFIDKMLDKNTNDPFKFKKHLIKQYKKEFPFTQQDLSENVKTVLASNFYPNFCFVFCYFFFLPHQKHFHFLFFFFLIHPPLQ